MGSVLGEPPPPLVVGTDPLLVGEETGHRSSQSYQWHLRLMMGRVMCWYYHRCLGRQHVGQVLRRRMFRSVPVCYLKGQLVVRRQGSPGEGAGLQNSREDEMRAMYCYYRCCLDRQHAGQALRRRMFRSVHVCYLKGQLAARHQDLLGEKTGVPELSWGFGN